MDDSNIKDDSFDWLDDEVVVTDESNGVEWDQGEEPEKLKSARDFIRHKTAKKMKDGSPAWKQGWAAGYIEGQRVGKQQGYRKGYEDALKQTRLPD